MFYQSQTDLLGSASLQNGNSNDATAGDVYIKCAKSVHGLPRHARTEVATKLLSELRMSFEDLILSASDRMEAKLSLEKRPCYKARTKLDPGHLAFKLNLIKLATDVRLKMREKPTLVTSKYTDTFCKTCEKLVRWETVCDEQKGHMCCWFEEPACAAGSRNQETASNRQCSHYFEESARKGYTTTGKSQVQAIMQKSSS